MFWRRDPGECIVCGAAHCACTVDGAGPILVEQLPATAAANASRGPASTSRRDDTTRTPTPDTNAGVATLQEPKLPTGHQSGAAPRVVGRSQPTTVRRKTT
jgi:hypothetical protein